MKNNEIKELIKESFYNIYLNKPLNEIRVSNICNKAHIGRSTFYNYYKNIDAILEEIENNVLNDMLKIYNEYNYQDITTLKDNNPAPNFYEMYKYVLKNKEIFNCMLKDKKGKFIVNSKISIKEKLETTFKKYIKNKDIINYTCDLCTEYILTSCSLLIKYDNIITPKTLALQTQKLILDIIKNKDNYFNERSEKNENN